MSRWNGSKRPRVIVCGSRFGRVYLAAFRDPAFPFELAGILARGSERSRACASHYGVPLYAAPHELPRDIDLACVVIGTGVIGGPGARLAQALMARGIHVLQEHPLHHDELAECLRCAREHGVVYRLNPFYRHLAPVRRFLAAARELLRQQRPVYVDAMCSVLVSYSLFDLLGQAFGRVRPWSFRELPPPPPALRELGEAAAPFRSLDGVFGGVPLTLRIQNQMNPGDPDSGAHVLHRIALGAEGGTLTLVDTHGPVMWTPRPNMPRDVENTVSIANAGADYVGYPSAAPIGPAEADRWRDILDQTWPAGVRRAVRELRRAIVDGEDPLRDGQYHLTLSRLWQDATARLGFAELLDGPPPRPLPADALRAAAAAEEAAP